MIQVKHIKKVTSLLLIFITALVLVACNTKGNVPYGDISNDTYISLGDDVTVTNKDLYDSLRGQSSSKLKQLIDEKIFEGYIKKANELLEKANNEEAEEEVKWAHNIIDETVNQAIFQTTDKESIILMGALRREITIEKYVDSLFASDNKIVRKGVDGLVEKIVNKVSDEENEEVFAVGYSDIEYLKNKYAIEVAKRLYAKTVLDEEQKDDDKKVKENQVISHYKNEVKGRHDVNVFYFYFLSLNEANAALRTFSLKSDARGNWYQIPDIRLVGWDSDLVKEKAEYINSLFEKLPGLSERANSISESDPTKTNISEEDFKKFYDAYSPTQNKSRDTALQTSEVFTLFIELNNLVNHKKLETVSVEEIKDLDVKDLKEFVKYQGQDFDEANVLRTYDDLNTLSSSFRSYIYDTLDNERPYSTLRSVGSYRYLAFKFDDVNPGIDLVSETKDKDGNDKWADLDELKAKYEEKTDLVLAAYPEANDNGSVNWEKVMELADAQKALWLEKVLENKLTSTYANNAVNELYKDNLKLEIYDKIIRTHYNHNFETQAKGKDKTGNVVAKVNITLNDEKIEFEITVNQLFEELERAQGVKVGLDLLVDQMLLKDEKELIDSKMKKEFEAEYKRLISNFSNDQFASAGYPASIGREAFLILIFDAETPKEAIKNGYIIPKLRELRTETLEDQLKHLDVNFFEAVNHFTEKQFDQFKGLAASHLLVYFDENGDGTPENPQEYLDSLEDEAKVLEIKEAIVELFDLIALELGQPKYRGNVAGGLTAIADEFQNSARINLNIATLPDKWTKFRSLGINLKYEALNTSITNSSNIITNSSTLDEVFYNRAMYLYDLIKEEIEDFADFDSYLDFDSNSINNIKEHDILSVDFLAKENEALNKPGIMSDFGFHFIVVTNLEKTVSAKFEKPSNYDPEEDDYTFKLDDKVYNIYNDEEKITIEQIEYFIKGDRLEDGVLVPSAVKQAFTKYLDPILELYKGNNMQAAILYNLLETNGLNTHGKEDIYNAMQDINRSQFFNYLLPVDGEVRDVNFEALYGDWFKVFGLEK